MQETELVGRLKGTRSPIFGELDRTCPECSALVVPLFNATEPVGVLILIRQPERDVFHPDEIGRAHTFSNLASLAFRKIYLLADSERRRRELERVTESRSRLVRGFSHDLKNPIGAADGYAQLLESGVYGPLEPRQREGIERSVGRCTRPSPSSGDLVELARSEAGQLEIHQTTTDVESAAREVAEEHRASAEAKGLSLTVETAPAVPTTMSDPSRVRQILGNLLSNAIKYTPSGEG